MTTRTSLTICVIAGLLATAGTTTTAGAAPAARESAAGAHAAACTKGACARRKARKLLADKVLIRFTETGSIGNYSSLDERLHLCKSSDFVFDTVSYIEGAGTYSERHTGRWRVVTARLRKGGAGSAKLRGTPDDGSPAITLKIAFDGSETRVDGAAVIVQRSDVC
jgi:hypothetical protein